MRGTLFVLDPDTADPVFLEHVENLQVRSARIAKQYVDAFKAET